MNYHTSTAANPCLEVLQTSSICPSPRGTGTLVRRPWGSTEYHEAGLLLSGAWSSDRQRFETGPKSKSPATTHGTSNYHNFRGEFKSSGAEERTRTSTPRRELHPECSASANSATSAHGHASIIRNPAHTLGRIALTAICHLAIQPGVCQAKLVSGSG
jgi:hypothetical protein